MNNFILKGHICYAKNQKELAIHENSYLVCEDGSSVGIFQEIPELYKEWKLYDYTDKIIIPGLVDLHMHAPQYAFRGLGMDLELIDWLNQHAFLEEMKYKELSYAKRAYEIVAEDLKKSATTRACIFATMHTEATLWLMERLAQSGIGAYVGKVNMDRNSPDFLCESSWEQSVEDTKNWMEQSKGFGRIKPILTPRFIPSCSDPLLRQLAVLQKQYKLPLQSHLSENTKEIAWVKELCPEAGSYGEAYENRGLFGENGPVVMAHCVHSGEDEIQLMKKNGVFIAHCPQSNMNLASGIAPVRKFLDMGLKVGLGSDIAAGASISIFRAMTDAIQCSKIRWKLQDPTCKPLQMEEVFYMGTKGGGAFFGKVGSLEAGYELDAIVLEDSMWKHPQPLTVRERLERLLYLSENGNIIAKFVSGECISL